MEGFNPIWDLNSTVKILISSGMIRMVIPASPLSNGCSDYHIPNQE